ncbi:MAG: aminoacyl-tRNA hydrolase [bacterium]|nr:aminoacyl-tRNA hydrolase [bacterium]
MFLIAGLGNPGLLYAKNRHNVGFKAINAISKLTGIKVKQVRCKSKIGKGTYIGQEIILAKPRTYMNRSGESILSLVQSYNIDISKIIIIYDDLDLTLGKIRIRSKGSAGGHNGLKSIIDCLNTQDIKRVRIGINPSFKITDSAQFVLSNFNKEENNIIEKSILIASQATLSIIKDGLEYAMNTYN